MIEKRIQELIKKEIINQQQANHLPHFELPVIEIESPQLEKHGDYACNIAFQLGGKLKMNPMGIGAILLPGIKKMVEQEKMLDQVELAPPGFLNFTLNSIWLSDTIGVINKKGKDFGKSNFGRQRKAQVEFVSANPTGPIHVAMVEALF